MCGIIAVLRRASRRQPPAADLLLTLLRDAEAALAQSIDTAALGIAAATLGRLDQQLKGVPGLWSLLQHTKLLGDLRSGAQSMQAKLTDFERSLDATSVTEKPDPDIEQRNAMLVRTKDALWAVLRDRLPHAEGVRELANGKVPHLAAAAAFSSLQTALSALDRLEVRGRDSAGLSVIVTGIDAQKPALRSLRVGRDSDLLFQGGSVRIADGCLNFVYKHAAEIGELGDNVRALRASMRADELLQAALREPGGEVLVLGHTRWASVGIISEPNAHPLNHEETAVATNSSAKAPYVIGALNGDVDNHHELVRRHDLHIHDAITTDAKVIP
ncbi:MAG: glucosamine-6-phosphate synthase, partial [Planctomycetota bacterium]